MPPRAPASDAPGWNRGPRWTLATSFLALLAVYLAVAYDAYWGFYLVAAEVLYPSLVPAWARLNGAVDRTRDYLEPFKRFPGALIGIPLLFVGLGLGRWAPESVQWLGNGVNSVIGGIAAAAPYIIFFTLTPAIAATIQAGNAGSFALWVNVAYVFTTVGAGLLAAVMMVPIFGVRLVGAGASGPGGGAPNLLELAFTSAPFIAIFLAVGLSLMIHGFRLDGVHEGVRFVGSKLIELAGDVLKILLPLILFALGVFIPTRVRRAVDRAREAGDVDGTGWIGGLDASAAYFVSVGVLVLLLTIWLVGFATIVMRYTGFPLRRFFGGYFLDVYAYAWATASSSATIPINLERTGSVLKVRQNVRDFIIPLGATINLDGTMMGGITVAVAAAQMVGYTPTLLDLVLILIPLAVITIGVPGVPGGLAIVAAPIMVELLPLPFGTEAAFTAIFIGFNIGLSDMFRTGVNSCDNGIMARLFEYWYPRRFARADDAVVAVPAAAPAAGAS